jgi:glutathione S-transferase
LDTAAAAYADQLLGTRALREWYAEALKETLRDRPHDDEISQAGAVLEDLRAT